MKLIKLFIWYITGSDAERYEFGLLDNRMDARRCKITGEVMLVVGLYDYAHINKKMQSTFKTYQSLGLKRSVPKSFY